MATDLSNCGAIMQPMMGGSESNYIIKIIFFI